MQQNNYKLCFLENMVFYLKNHGINISPCLLMGILGMYGFTFRTESDGQSYRIYGRSGSFQYEFEKMMHALVWPLQEQYIRKEDITPKVLFTLLNKWHQIILWIDDFYVKSAAGYYKIHELRPVVLTHMFDETALFYDIEMQQMDIKKFIDLVSADGIVKIHYAIQEKLEWKFSLTELLTRGFGEIIAIYGEKAGYKRSNIGINEIMKLQNELRELMTLDVFFDIYSQMNFPGGLYQSQAMMAVLCAELREKQHLNLPS